MSSFLHPSGITTLHRLVPEAWPALEADLAQRTLACPITLILPCHARELGTPALQGIVRELAAATWLARLVIGLDGADSSHLSEAKQVFASLPQDTRLLWTGDPTVLELEAALARAGQTTASAGKGRNAWLCAGLACALAEGPAIAALHDCDIRNYSRELPGRLCHPLLEPAWGFRFNKGFYSRHSDRLHGRLQRLLVRPLLRSMELCAGPVAALQFLSAFRYPLAGESALDLALLRQLTFCSTWGLEIGLLDEVRRHLPPVSICQTEVCAAYDHKHQELSPDDPSIGLHRMAREVAGALLATVSGGTYPWREQILEVWQTHSAEALRHAAAESALNGLHFLPDQEALARHTFGRALQAALEQPAPPALLPSWNAVESALPGSLARLRQAVPPLACPAPFA